MKLSKPSFVLLSALAVLALSLATPSIAAPQFYNDYNSGVAAAKAANKPMVVVFSAAWCGPCQHMKQAVYPSAPVAPYHDDFVWVYLDIDDPRNATAVAQHRVGPIPHISFKDSSGSSVETLKGATRPDQFANLLEKVSRKTGNTATPPAVSSDSKSGNTKWKGFNFLKRKNGA